MNPTHLFEVSTLYGLATLNAALRAGLFPDAGSAVLVCSNNAGVPEAVADLTESPAFARLAEPFGRVVSYNDAIAPLHPSAWTPAEPEMPLWERYFRMLWDLGDSPVHLVVESIQVSPAQALAWSFPQASIDVYADGLMSYGPTRNKILSEVGARIERLLHLDLVPGLDPLLLEEFAVRRDIIPADAFRDVLSELAADAPVPSVAEATAPVSSVAEATAPVSSVAEATAPVSSVAIGEPVGLLLGQYLSPLGLVSAAREAALHTAMLEAAVARGCRRIVFKPHPTAPADLAGPMLARAAELGAGVEVFAQPVLAEALFERMDIGVVVGCFSTALMTAQSLYGLPVVAVGTADVLAALKPFPNSNRIPLVVVDSLMAQPDRPPRLTVPQVARLAAAVGFVMQPEVLSHRRAEVGDWLWEHGEAEARFFPAARLGELDLPGGRRSLTTRVAPTLRRVARSAYAMERKLEERVMGPIRGVPGGG